jgi:succinate dehydrogenase hydrophobic anchor subunit
MAEEASGKAGKFLALAVLLTALIFAISGLYIVLNNLGQSDQHPLSLGLAALVSILILLILSMMVRILAGMRKSPVDESSRDSPLEPY